MSSIIKGGRIRSQGIINLSERAQQSDKVEEVYEDVNDGSESDIVTSKVIEEKKQELEELDKTINEKINEANSAAEGIIAAAYAKAKEIENKAHEENINIIAEAQKNMQIMLKEAEENALKIEQSAKDEKEKMLSGTEGEVVETMILLLNHIISEEINYNVDWIKFIVRKMIRKQEINDDVTLEVSSNEFNKLQESNEDLLNSIKKLSSIKEDESLNDSTIRLITSEGNIEYDVKEGLNRVITELRILKGLS